MAELLTEAEFLIKKKSAKMHGEKLKIEEKYAKSKAKVKILETIESEYRKREFNEIANTKDKRTKLLMKSQEFSIK